MYYFLRVFSLPIGPKLTSSANAKIYIEKASTVIHNTFSKEQQCEKKINEQYERRNQEQSWFYRSI